MAGRRRYRSFRGHYAKYGVVRLVHGVATYGRKVGYRLVYGIIDNAFERSDAMAFHSDKGTDNGGGNSGGELERTAGLGAVANHSGEGRHHILDSRDHAIVVAAHKVAYSGTGAGGGHHASA